MKYIKKFNENIDNQNDATKSDYDPSKGRGQSYKENLGRGDNEFVYKVLPELENLIGNEMDVILKKISDAVRSKKLPDANNDFGRDYGLALGSIFYTKFNKK